MEPVKVWRETVFIPTYETGPQDTHPMFLENRVYQGSTGAVYPYGVTDTLSDSKTEKAWQAVWLENDYLKIMILPELGGRVQKAFDKVKQRDFVYHNEVIKPALVGLLGPWIWGALSSTGHSTIARPPTCRWIARLKSMTTAARRYGSEKLSRCTGYR